MRAVSRVPDGTGWHRAAPVAAATALRYFSPPPNPEIAMASVSTCMGSDAPQSMGFTVTPGNQVHVNLQPDTRAEHARTD